MPTAAAGASEDRAVWVRTSALRDMFVEIPTAA